MVERRRVLGGAAAAIGAGATLAAPAVAQSAPEIRWRLTSSFPRSLDILFDTASLFSRTVAALTDGRFQIQPFAAGEIVPGLQALDAVTGGAVECCHTVSYYYVGKDPAFAFGTAIPFGPNARIQAAWLYAGGGNEMLDAFYDRFGVRAFPFGNTGCQMGGWFRKEINGTVDLRGLKFRVGGIAGQILARLGVVPQQIAAGDVYAALERGTIDAAEWIGPYDDEKLGFVKIAKNYYYPGFWDGGAMSQLFVRKDQWDELPPTYKAAVEVAANQSATFLQARYDAQNPPAIKRLVAAGAVLRPFPEEVMRDARREADALYGELRGKSADFARIYDNLVAFRDDGYLWWQVGELTYDSLMVRQRGRI